MKHGHYHFFSVADFPPNTEILATYDVFFVLVSVLIAISASLISFVLAAKMAQTEMQNERTYWSLASACFLGFGIWSMHFVGMLAYQLPLVVSYDPFITLLSSQALLLWANCLTRQTRYGFAVFIWGSA
ncbi:MHYT domain-containing protein [Alteromonas sp. HB246098]